MKEHLLSVICYLCDLYGDDVAMVPGISAKVGALLGESQPSVRKIAVDVLIRFHSVFGDSLLVRMYMLFMKSLTMSRHL